MSHPKKKAKGFTPCMCPTCAGILDLVKNRKQTIESLLAVKASLDVCIDHASRRGAA